MDIRKNVSLKDYSTMRLGGEAAFLTEVHNKSEVEEAVAWAAQNQVTLMMIGGGSNIIWPDSGYPGLVLVNRIMGFKKYVEDQESTYFTLGAGEVWDEMVERSVKDGLTGIEALSLIPGTVGATPVQNVGAYGQQISDVLVSIEAYDTLDKKYLTIAQADCAFSYRNSRFKEADKGRFLITGITIHLRHSNPEPPFYPSVQSYFTEHGISQYTPQVLRDAVVSIRQSKLPDPAIVANNGSFFTNPIINETQLEELLERYPAISYWRLSNDQVKISAAWLVEQAGFKGMHDQETGMTTWPNQALVFVNEHAKSTADLLKFKQKVTDKVQAMFNISLVQEPELVNPNV